MIIKSTAIEKCTNNDALTKFFCYRAINFVKTLLTYKAKEN